MTLPRPAVAAGLLAAGALVLTACGGGTDEAVPAAGAPAGSAPTASSAPSASDGPTGDAIGPGAAAFPTALIPTLFTSPPAEPAGGGLPADFPVPPGATVLDSDDGGTQTAARLRVPSATSAFDFYLSALPAAGYSVTSADRGALPAAGEIRLAGQGFSGNSQLVFSGSTVTVQLERS